jgi:hypothetical protein
VKRPKDMLNSKRARGVVILVIVTGVILLASVFWTWASSGADRAANQQATALRQALNGVKPYQLLADSGASLRRTVHVVTIYGGPDHLVIQAQPKGFLHIRCVVADLDATGHYDIVIQDSGCAGR